MGCHHLQCSSYRYRDPLVSGKEGRGDNVNTDCDLKFEYQFVVPFQVSKYLSSLGPRSGVIVPQLLVYLHESIPQYQTVEVFSQTPRIFCIFVCLMLLRFTFVYL